MLAASVNATEPVNIISWWSYINPEIKSEIEDKCDVQISVDEYYSNPEFLRRVKRQNHDIAIYSDTVYRTFIDAVSTATRDISSGLVNQYIEPLQEEYYRSNYLTNTVYYQFSLTGFLWNPNIITLNKKDSIKQIFAKAETNTVVVLDEHVEVLNLLSKIEESGLSKNDFVMPSISKVLSLFKDSDIVVANALGSLVNKNDFAFAYTWSGEALWKIQTVAPQLKFLVHPKLSHWSKDLITLISSKDSSACVIRELAGSKHLNKLAVDTYYFSPYANEYYISDAYNDIYNAFIESLKNIQPLKRLSPEQYDELDLEWQKIKVNL